MVTTGMTGTVFSGVRSDSGIGEMCGRRTTAAKA